MDYKIDDALKQQLANGERDLRKCKKCNEIKWRVLDGTFDGVNKKWRQEDGKLWNGSTCGECNLTRMKESTRKLRAIRKAEAAGE